MALAAPVAQLRSELAGWPWDSEPLVTLTLQDATNVLARCLGGDVSLARTAVVGRTMSSRDTSIVLVGGTLTRNPRARVTGDVQRVENALQNWHGRQKIRLGLNASGRRSLVQRKGNRSWHLLHSIMMQPKWLRCGIIDFPQ